MITKEVFENIATLSRLSKGEEEYNRFAQDLSSMVAFADKIKDVPLAKDEELSQAECESALREDTVELSFEREEILSNAPCSQDGYFLLRKRA